jgi:UPF0755 protein
MMSDRRAEAQQSRSQRGDVRPRSPAEALEPMRAPSRPRGAKIRRERPRLNRTVKWMSGLLTSVLMLLAVSGAAAAYLYHQLDAPGPLDVTRSIAIPRGEGRIEIAARLEREGVINNRYAFILGHIYHSWGNKKNFDLKAGEYEIKRTASLRQVMDTLVEGKSVQFNLTIPEGLTSQQIIERLKADPNLVGDLGGVPPEGTLRPQTYRFAKGMSRQEILDWMLAEQKKVLAEAWKARQPGLPFQTMEQALVMSSIVEKETGREDERTRVAAVFVNRLRKGMRLQSDPTIVYGIAGGQGSLGRPISRADIDGKTAYNTYQIDGLPPTPICNPGLAAIKATLNPAKTSDLFFVVEGGTGRHVFTQNLKDHNAAVASLRRYEREAKARPEAGSVQNQPTRAVSVPAPLPSGEAQQGAGEPAQGAPPQSPDGAAAAGAAAAGAGAAAAAAAAGDRKAKGTAKGAAKAPTQGRN